MRLRPLSLFTKKSKAYKTFGVSTYSYEYARRLGHENFSLEIFVKLIKIPEQNLEVS